MKVGYPIILTSVSPGYVVHVPDFEINTEGEDLDSAVEMARDAIGLMGATREDFGESLPKPFSILASARPGQMLRLIEVDFDKYRRQYNADADDCDEHKKKRK